MSELVLGEAVPVDVTTAGIPSRTVAFVIDFAVQVAALVGAVALLAAFANNVDEALAAALSIVVTVVVFLGYPAVLETAWRGRTLGKAAMGLRVVRDDGGPIRFRHALGRAVVGYFVERPGVTLGLAAVVTSFVNRRGKRLGDLLAGTVVVQQRVPSRDRRLPAPSPGLAAWATTLDLSGLDDALALNVRRFLGRLPDLRREAADELAGRLATAVAAVTAPKAPPGTPAVDYLAAVLAERRRRQEQRAGTPPTWGAP